MHKLCISRKPNRPWYLGNLWGKGLSLITWFNKGGVEHIYRIKR